MPAYSTHDEHGVLFIGRTKCGKSTLSKSGGFAVSQHEMSKAASADLKPSVSIANRADFWRLEPGQKTKPSIADEIDLTKVPKEDMKLLANPSDPDRLVWARWGGAQLATNQCTQFCINPYDKRLELNS